MIKRTPEDKVIPFDDGQYHLIDGIYFATVYTECDIKGTYGRNDDLIEDYDDVKSNPEKEICGTCQSIKIAEWR